MKTIVITFHGMEITNTKILISLYSLGGLLSLYFFTKSLLEMRGSNHWPSVEGKIVSSSLGIQQGEDQLYYQPMIIYSYNVGGRDFQAKRVVIGQIPVNTGKDWAQLRVDKYPAGKRINVFYNPKAPEKAVLEPGWNSQLLVLWFGIALVGGFLIFCLAFLITWVQNFSERIL